MVLYGVRLLINIFDLFIFRRYLETFVGHRKTSTEFPIVLLLILEVAGSVINQINDGGIINLLVCFLIFGLYTLQYQKSTRTKLIAILVYMGICIITEPMGYSIHMLASGFGTQNEIETYYFIALVMEISRLIIVEIFCHIKREKKISVMELPKEIIYVLFSIPLVSVISCILLIEIAGKIMNTELIILCMTIVFIIFICNYLMFTMVNRYTELTEERHEEELAHCEATFKQEYYRDMDEAIQQMHTIKHDIKNQLAALHDALIHERDEEAINKLKAMLDIVTETGKNKYSDNPIVNSILRTKVAEARKHDIRLKINIFVPKKMNIDIGDYGIMYGNLWDNAIEACVKLPKEERFIDFNTKYQAGKLLLTIINSKSENENSRLLTTKKDKIAHGRGLKSVRKVCENYGGTFLPVDKGNLFQTDVLLTEIECIE